MLIQKYEDHIPKDTYSVLLQEGITELRPCQIKAIDKGVMHGKSMIVCSPTASGKTLVGEMACINTIVHQGKKAVYIVPLKALANEKFRDFRKRYGNKIKIALSIGDLDESESYLASYDLIICTAEKLDSLLRHHTPWITSVKTIVVDEIHLLNDPGRGPTLEVLMTLLRQVIPGLQIIGLSATIGNPEMLAAWLEAELVLDGWRPVKLHEGVYLDGEIEFVEKD
ncbi:DEAD/DEAH box helicase [Candidatus Woesearchaeota archaeon]|nr:DEAD/DEAH box helicase [Candidatus Woesearchaeota archaeon]